MAANYYSPLIYSIATLMKKSVKVLIIDLSDFLINKLDEKDYYI